MNDKIITAEQAQFTDEQRKLISDVLCKGANPIEIQFYLNVAERLKLDPFKRQIHAMKRKVDGKETMQFMVSIEGLRSIASRCKTDDGKDAYAGNSKPKFTHDKEGNLESAEVTVLRIVQGQPREFTAEVFYDECVQMKGIWENNRKVGEAPNAFWEKRPKGQLGKCAEAAALRKAFPEETSGVYIEDELPDAEDVKHETEKPKPPTPQAEGMEAEATVVPQHEDGETAPRHWSDLLIENAYNLVKAPDGTPWAGKALWEIAKEKGFEKAFKEVPREDTVFRHALDARYFANLKTRYVKKGYDEDEVNAALRKAGFLTEDTDILTVPGERLMDLGTAINDLPQIQGE